MLCRRLVLKDGGAWKLQNRTVDSFSAWAAPLADAAAPLADAATDRELLHFALPTTRVGKKIN